MEAIVHFDPECGKVVSVGNSILDDGFPYIKVRYSEVEKILSGHETVDQYKVLLDPDTKEYSLETWYDSTIKILSWDENMYRIPLVEQASESSDVILYQNLKDKTWTFKIRWDIFNVISRSNNRLATYTEFYVTRANDANVLLQTIRFNVDHINDKGETFIQGIDFDQPISVYCRKIFNTYAHVQI
jgi:hypothetical protein